MLVGRSVAAKLYLRCSQEVTVRVPLVCSVGVFTWCVCVRGKWVWVGVCAWYVGMCIILAV